MVRDIRSSRTDVGPEGGYKEYVWILLEILTYKMLAHVPQAAERSVRTSMLGGGRTMTSRKEFPSASQQAEDTCADEVGSETRSSITNLIKLTHMISIALRQQLDGEQNKTRTQLGMCLRLHNSNEAYMHLEFCHQQNLRASWLQSDDLCHSRSSWRRPPFLTRHMSKQCSSPPGGRSYDRTRLLVLSWNIHCHLVGAKPSELKGGFIHVGTFSHVRIPKSKMLTRHEDGQPRGSWLGHEPRK